MAATSILQVLLDISGLESGSARTARHEFTNVDAPAQITQVTLASGFNSITVPSNARGVAIFFDPDSMVAKTLKGVTGDTGIVVEDTVVLVFRSSAVPATIGITAASADTSMTTEIIFF